MHKARNGDRRAFESLVSRHAGSLYALALRMTGVRAEAEDMVQESFLRAFANMHRFDGQKRFHTWLYTICLNVLRDGLRRRKTAPGRLPYEALEALADAAPLPEQRLQRNQSRDALLAAVAALPLDQREALVLRFFQELSFAEVATVCDITENAAKKRVYQALSRLHDMLEPEQLTFPGGEAGGSGTT